MTASVTVVIPFLRGGNEDWLRQAIGSLPKDTLYKVAENDGELADALNTALAEVKTEFVFRLDADDILEKDCLRFLTAMAWDADVTYPSLLWANEQLETIEFRKAGMYCPNRLAVWNYIPGVALFRPEKALEVGGYRDLPVLEDWDLWLRMSRAGARFKAVPEAVYLYRQHKQKRNQTTRSLADIRQEMRGRVVGDSEPDMYATFYYQASAATTYWRCLLPARYLPGQAVDHAGGELAGEDSLAFPDHRGAAVFQFPGDAARAVFMAEMQDQGIRVLVESDDSYFERSPQGTPDWDDQPNGRGSSREAHRKMLPWVDGVIVTTPHLAKRYAKHTDAPIYVCPNQIDPADWPEPEREDAPLRVGWFFSPSHQRDGALIHRALEWASRQDGVEVWTMGDNPGWTFRRTHIPWSNDMGVYRKIIGKLDIGLAPVVETPWSACRSDLKSLEYGISAVATILSDATPYKTYAGPCLRAGSAKDFYNHVRHLVRNPDEARALGAAAREHVLAERTVERNIWRWREAISGG